LDAINRPAPSLSFEFYPPQSPAAAEALAARAATLDATGPDFVSVTYGAGGGDVTRRAASFEAMEILGGATEAARLAHLTLAGHQRSELVYAIAQFVAAGAEGFMALRGDPPGGPRAPWPDGGELTYALDLVELLSEQTNLPIGVAAFPYGHPTAASLEHDAAVLARKQAAGASFAVSQVVFDPAAYFRLRERAIRAGATLPIVPGIMPVTAGSKEDKLVAFSGAPLPAALSARLAAAPDPAAREAHGTEWAVETVRALIAGGAPGVHLYTLNSTQAAEAVAADLATARGVGRRR
jgi:methylenetetrahydrofolate reductase (NADPH)